MTKVAMVVSRMRLKGAFFVILVLVGVLVLLTQTTKWKRDDAPSASPSVSPEVLALLERGKASVREDVDRMQHASALLTALNTHTHTQPQAHSQAQRRGVLCVTFQSWSEANSAHLARNVLSLGEACHWLVLVYNSRGKDDAEMLRDLHRDMQREASTESNRNNNNKSVHLLSHIDANESSPSPSSSSAGESAHGRQRITIMQPPRREDSVREFRRLCESYLFSRSLSRSLANTSCAFIHEPPTLDSSSGAINRKLYPKVMMLLSVLSRASQYEHVWLLDGDLSFEGFDFAEYRRIHRCAFDTPPLVSQPAIAEGRAYQYLGSPFWRGSPYIASKLGFVEIMTPFMDSQFFEWFVLAFVVPMFGPMHVMAADWGFDELFCKAALWFHQTRSGNGNNSKALIKSLSLSNDAENQCAVIISTPIQHADSKEIDKAIGGEGSKEVLNNVLRDAIAEHYRPLYWTGGEEAERIKRIYGNLFKLKGKSHSNTKGRVVATKQDCSVDA